MINNREANQKAFNVIVAHLRQQKTKCKLPAMFGGDMYGPCAYRGNKGKKCAVGCLIADEHYSPRLEKHVASEDVILEALEKSGWGGVTTQFLREVQELHDYSDPQYWEAAFVSLAKIWKLEVPDPQQHPDP